ncbi:MAG: hypothetical protein KAQ83_02625 [Nanoarchaeota archaeon]|nr:hypothetical protein [Nanoarchaeota archaeon]
MCFEKCMKKFKKMPNKCIYMYISAKCVFCFGLGVLLAGYLAGYAWYVMGLGFLLALPGAFRILKK